MGGGRDRDWAAEERRMAYAVGWRMGLARAVEEIKRPGGRTGRAGDALEEIRARLEALAEDGPGAGTEAKALAVGGGEPLRLGYSGTGEAGPGGLRFFLGGRPVHPGDRVELCLSGGRRVRGLFGWTGRADDRPTLTLELVGDFEPEAVDPELIAGARTLDIPRVSFALPEAAVLRW